MLRKVETVVTRSSIMAVFAHRALPLCVARLNVISVSNFRAKIAFTGLVLIIIEDTRRILYFRSLYNISIYILWHKI